MGSVLFAVREIRRSKGRFGLLAAAVGVLVFLIVFQQALLDGLITQFVGAIRNQSATVLVYGEDARLNLQGSRVGPETVAAVAAVPGVAEAGPLGVATVTVDAGGELQDATVFGHQPDGPGQPRTIIEGRRPAGPGEAVASSADADAGFDIGDTVTVLPGDTRLEVVGLAREANFSVTPTLFTSYATYESLLLAANPAAPAVLPSAVAVIVEDGADPAEVAARIDDQVPGVEALDRAAAAAEAPGVESVSQSLNLVLLLSYVVATIIIGFFFLILTVQKSGPLTLLRALGVPTRRLVGSLAVQVAAVVGAGLIIGTSLAVLALGAASTGIGASVQVDALLTTVVVVFALAAVACIGSVRRVVRLDPAAAAHAGGGLR